MKQVSERLRRVWNYWFHTPTTCEFYHYQQFASLQKRYL